MCGFFSHLFLCEQLCRCITALNTSIYLFNTSNKINTDSPYFDYHKIDILTLICLC